MARTDQPPASPTIPRLRVLAARAPDAWRAQTRELLASGTDPQHLEWVDPAQPQATLDFAAPLPQPRQTPSAPPGAPTRASTPSVPREFLSLARLVLAHDDPDRFATLYQVLWRLTRRGERLLLNNPADPDTARLGRWAKAVRRDMHKMKAFVRFRRLDDPSSPDGSTYVAYHRPDYDIVDLVGPFFANRFGVMRWTILTPKGSLLWDGQSLTSAPPASSRDGPRGDALEDVWKVYYASVFNPARANPRAMLKEMPRKHWATLPEAGIIDELLRAAARRTGGMLDTAPVSGKSAADFLPAQRPAPLHVLQEAAKSCRGCPLHETATCTVFGRGPADARIMLVGEQPGDEEDRAGVPFIGPAGRVLDRALSDAGLDRSTLYITNAVKHFKWTPDPTGKRRIHSKPGIREIVACRAWLEQEIGAVAPGVIVLLGATAAQSLLGPGFRITKDRGTPLRNTRWAPTLIATFHPSAILRTPDPDAKARLYNALVADLALAASHAATA